MNTNELTSEEQPSIWTVCEVHNIEGCEQTLVWNVAYKTLEAAQASIQERREEEAGWNEIKVPAPIEWDDPEEDQLEMADPTDDERTWILMLTRICG